MWYLRVEKEHVCQLCSELDNWWAEIAKNKWHSRGEKGSTFVGFSELGNWWAETKPSADSALQFACFIAASETIVQF